MTRQEQQLILALIQIVQGCPGDLTPGRLSPQQQIYFHNVAFRILSTFNFLDCAQNLLHRKDKISLVEHSPSFAAAQVTMLQHQVTAAREWKKAVIEELRDLAENRLFNQAAEHKLKKLLIDDCPI